MYSFVTDSSRHETFSFLTSHLVIFFIISLFRSIFQDVLRFQSSSDESTFASKATGTRSYYTKGGTVGSYSSGGSHNTHAIKYLQELCDELDAPEGFFEIVGGNLLGNGKVEKSKIERAPELEDIISTMARLFVRCTSHAETIILALDDVQWMDSLSWKVVQCILEQSQHILIVCGSRYVDHKSLSMTAKFWDKINGEYKTNGICTNINMSPLDLDSVREMAAIALLCQPADLDDSFCDDIYKHSGGMPHFASEILENCIRQKECEVLDNGKIGWRSDLAQVSSIYPTFKDFIRYY